MQFNETSGLVKVWVSLIKANTYTEDQVPPIENLKEMVHTVLTGGENK